MRLAKYLAHAGVASRRAAEEIVRSGRVTVAGDVVDDPARDVGPADDVALDGAAVVIQGDRVVYALHKPRGVVSTARDTHGRQTVVDLVPAATRVYPVGRLDVDTSGLILLTDDGELANLLTHPRHEVPKTYRATVGGPPISDRALRRLRVGIELDDGLTLPARAARIGPHELEITLREGRKRQVRRMCEAVGHPVEELVRIALGPLQLGTLRPREHRLLADDEVTVLRAAAVRGEGSI